MLVGKGFVTTVRMRFMKNNATRLAALRQSVHGFFFLKLSTSMQVFQAAISLETLMRNAILVDLLFLHFTNVKIMKCIFFFKTKRKEYSIAK